MEEFHWINDYSENDIQFAGDFTPGSKVIDCANSIGVSIDILSDINKAKTIKQIKASCEECKFKGFDLEEVKCTILKTVAKLYPDINSKDKRQSTKARNAYDADIISMCCYATSRSMNLAKIDDLGQNRSKYRDIFMRWNLKSRLTGDEKIGGLTLSRICLAFPIVYIKALLVSGNALKFGHVEGLELIYHCALAPSIIPRNKWGIDQLKKWVVWSKRFCSQINSGKPETAKKEALKTTGSITKIQFENGYSHVDRLLMIYEIFGTLAGSDLYNKFFAASCVSDETFMKDLKAELMRLHPQREEDYNLFEKVITKKLIRDSVINATDLPTQGLVGKTARTKLANLFHIKKRGGVYVYQGAGSPRPEDKDEDEDEEESNIDDSEKSNEKMESILELTALEGDSEEISSLKMSV